MLCLHITKDMNIFSTCVARIPVPEFHKPYRSDHAIALFEYIEQETDIITPIITYFDC